MERRIVLTGLVAFAAAPAFAQSAPGTDAPAMPKIPENPQTPAPAPAMKVAPPITMSDASEKHLKETMAVGSLSLVVSRIALPKVKHAALKQFAGFEVAEQETIGSILKAAMMPGGPPSGDVKAPTDADLMGNLDPAGKGVVEKMRAMKAGPDFDRDYIKAQIDGHQQLLKIQDAYLAAPDNVNETNVALLARGMIKEHLALLAGLEKAG